MQTIRSFIAIPLAPDIRRSAVRLIGRLSQDGDGIKWVPTDNLHLTLKFLGEVENTEVPRVCDVVTDVSEQFEPFDLAFRRTGGFPDIERPRVLWVGIEEAIEPLCQLVGQLEKELAKLGFKREPRDYRPHLALGRTRSGSRRAGSEVVERMKSQADIDLGIMRVDTIQIYASFLDKAGPTYQVMDTVHF